MHHLPSAMSSIDPALYEAAEMDGARSGASGIRCRASTTFVLIGGTRASLHPT